MQYIYIWQTRLYLQSQPFISAIFFTHIFSRHLWMFVIHLMMARGAETCCEKMWVKNIAEIKSCDWRYRRVCHIYIYIYIYCKVTQQDATYRNKITSNASYLGDPGFEFEKETCYIYWSKIVKLSPHVYNISSFLYYLQRCPDYCL
jgi:hypothetical protein